MILCILIYEIMLFTFLLLTYFIKFHIFKFNLKNCKNGSHNLIKNFPIKDYSYQASKIFRLLLFSFQLAIRSC